MNTTRRTLEARLPDLAPAAEVSIPAWVDDLLRAQSLVDVEGGPRIGRFPLAGLRFQHVTVGFDGARAMDILTFEQRVFAAYRSIFEMLASQPASNPVRFWNFVPGIHDDLGAGIDRYMAFNAGRFGAYAAHFGRPAVFARAVPTASAVGVPGDRFTLHCLASNERGVPVENPRQVPAYHYSRRFGPMPPCFARATLMRGENDTVLLVGGTASITGEDSQHRGRLEEQSQETLRNLSSLIASASGERLAEETTDLERYLSAFKELRVYYTRPADQPAIAAFIKSNFSPHCRVEMLPASLCRAELLIEVEGVAFPRSQPGHIDTH